MLRKIGDKEFTLIDRFPAKQFHGLFKRLTLDVDAFMELSLADQIKPYVGTVTAWPFSGNPLDPKAWEDLDIFEELPVAFRVVNEFATERMRLLEEQAKN